MTAFCKAKAKSPRLRGILTGRPHRGLPLAAVHRKTFQKARDFPGLFCIRSPAELTVRKENKAAVHLYEKSGFVIEGLRKNSMRVGGVYADEYYMAKFIPQNEGA